MKKILFFSFVCSILLSADSFAQRTCGTNEYNQNLMKSIPAFAEMQQRIEKQTQDFIKRGGSRSMLQVSGITTTTYTIPVVVHVVWNNTVQNISDAQVLSQIDVLNKDYQLLNADANLVPDAFKPLRANYQIQFCLAKKDPNGNPTTGIIRKKTTKSSFNSNDNVKFSSKGGDDAWPTGDYLNIWVCHLGWGLLGYAQFPGGPVNTDGVVIEYDAFGNTGKVASPYNLGRSATHEIGHWLNLRHIWGDATCGNDFVDDTPKQRKENYGCPSFPHLTCDNTTSGDMFMNYMDYTDDRCMYMFTIGQQDRSYAILQPGGSRYSITQSNKCGTTLATAANQFTNSIKNITNSTARIYPQPANTYVNIEFNSSWKGSTSITVINEIGSVINVKQANAESRTFKLYVSTFTSGVYYIRLNNNTEVVTQKLIVQH